MEALLEGRAVHDLGHAKLTPRLNRSPSRHVTMIGLSASTSPPSSLVGNLFPGHEVREGVILQNRREGRRDIGGHFKFLKRDIESDARGLRAQRFSVQASVNNFLLPLGSQGCFSDMI